MPTAYSPLPNPYSPEEAAILSIKVIDPAAGSGHFLIAAAHRLARHLARARTGDEEPSPAALRAALREVVRHCIHGVDINPMAVELCKVALWMETLDPGKPLGFLDRNIQCGNSLIGATPALLEKGIPDEAFTAITGDDKGYCAEFKKQNKKEREEQRSLITRDDQPWDRLGNLAAAVAGVEAVDDATLDGVRREETLYEELVRSSGYRYGQLLADAWCAAFVWKKTKEFAYPITEQVFREIERNPFNLPKWMEQEIGRLAEQYQFFHWHLAFPHVFKGVGSGDGGSREWAVGSRATPHSLLPTPSSGFDVVLGNPPWERIKLQEKEWFAVRVPEIANAANADARRKLIAALERDDPALFAAYREDLRAAEGESHLIRNSGRYPLCGRGDVNTYAVFAELARTLQSPAGRVGIIVPSGIATDDTTKFYFQDVTANRALASLYDFENRNAIFPGVHRSYKFCLLTLTGAARPAAAGAEFVFFALDVQDLRDPERRFTLSAEDIALLNPNTRTCPIFRSQRDAELTKSIYRRVPVLVNEATGENPWGIHFATMFHMSNDSGLFRTREQLEAQGFRLAGNRFVRGDEVYLPLYEAKMANIFDHRAADVVLSATAVVRQGQPERLDPQDHANPNRLPQPRYWIREAEVSARLGRADGVLLGYTDVSSPTNERSFLPTLLPRAGIGNTMPLMLSSCGFSDLALLATNLSSFMFDYATRQKMGGLHLNFFIVCQLPALPQQAYDQKWRALVLPRVLELTYTAWDLEAFGREVVEGWLAACDGRGVAAGETDPHTLLPTPHSPLPPYRWDEFRRFLLRCELDAAYFHLYGIARDDVAYIMDTFPIVRRKDEAAYGEYRTRRVILEMYDEMAEAMRTGTPYRTHLDPPPADPRVAHAPRPREGGGMEAPRAFTPAPAAPVAQAGDERAVAPHMAEKQAGYKPSTAAPVRPQKPVATGPAPTAAPGLFPDMPGAAQVKDARPTKAAAMGQNEHAAQAPLLIPRVAAPAGTYNERLAAVMKVRNDRTPLGIGTLIAALGDPENNIRWLAALSLSDVRGEGVAAALADFLASAALVEGKLEAVKLLGKMGGDTARVALRRVAGDNAYERSVRQAAHDALRTMG